MKSFTDVTKRIYMLAWPIAIAAAVQTSYHLINAFWLGRLGPDALAVVSLSFPINLLVISVASGLALAATIFVAKQTNSEDKKQLSYCATQALSSIALLGVAITVAMRALAPVILGMLSVAENIFEGALGYLQITLLGTVFLCINSMYQAVLRGMGEAKAPLRIIILGVILNGLLDPILIFGLGPLPALDVNGAAIATLITQVITALLGLLLTYQRRYGLIFYRAHLLPQKAFMLRLCRLGLPASVEQTMQSFTIYLMTVLVAPFGSVAIASYGIVFRLMTFTIIPAFSISIAVSILMGQESARKDIASAKYLAISAALLNTVGMLLIAIVLIVAAPEIIYLFTPDDIEMQLYGASVLRIFALSFPLMGFTLGLTGAFRGAGNTLAVMLLTLAGIWLVQLPLAYLLSRHTFLADTGIWWTSVIAGVINTTAAYAYYRSGFWYRHWGR